MAVDCVDGDYLGAYSRFFTDFIARVNPDDQLPVKVSAYDVNESELVGEIISVTLQYLNQTYCPPSLQSYIVHLVIQAIKLTCKKQPEICGLRQQEKTYAPLKLMQAITNSVNEICRRYLDNSRLALLPPPSPTQQVSVGATRNARRKMEDRHVVLHDLHTIFNIKDDTMANYYAVFDGHGGQDAAAYCATHLHQYLAESAHYPTDPERALRDAFLTTDAQFIAKSSTQKLNGGTTAVCALVLNKKLYIAWVGDSMASLVTRGNVKQLVNPHRPTRKDECERIQNMGGVIVHCMGVLRVNGFLSISRAIGDVSYKPYISGEPEIRCVPLDGTEDFLIIACDGLWDYVDPRTAALRVYRQVLQNPHELKYVQQALLQSAKRAGSLDNITVIVVFLKSPIEIAASQHTHLANQPSNGLLLNNMDPNNPISSNPGQFDVNAAFIKQQQQQLNADLQHAAVVDRVIYETTRNGKHQNNDDDYDFSDLGPETNVDAIEDVDPDVVDYRNTMSSVDEKSAMNEECNNDCSSNDKNDNNDDGDLNCDNANVCPVEPLVDVDNRVRPSDRNARDADDEAPCSGKADDEARVDSTGTHTVVDDDESPPSPRATKPLQHALIPEAENVADSEDSEDEWNYYRVGPNKGESVATTVAAEKICKGVEELDIQEKNTVSIAKGSLEFTSPEIVDDIKCEKLEKEIPSSELVNIDISDKEKPSKSVKDLIFLENQEQINSGDMDFQLNPEAAEFVPLSSPLLSNRNFLQDYPISGSPLKQTPMDDIPVPSQSEFEKEVCQRPREMDEKDFAQQANNDERNLDVSDVSSTKVEVGDSMANTSASTQWQADTSSQWAENTCDDATKLNLEEYDIVDKNDPMMMSYEPDEFAATFKKSLDLNAVHDLSDSSESSECKVKDTENGTEESDESEPDRLSRSPITIASEKRVHTPLSDDKDTINVLCTSSTPQPSADEKTECADSFELKGAFFTSENPFLEQSKDFSVSDSQTTRNTTQVSSVISSETTSDDLACSKSTDDSKHTSSVNDNLCDSSNLLEQSKNFSADDNQATKNTTQSSSVTTFETTSDDLTCFKSTDDFMDTISVDDNVHDVSDLVEIPVSSVERDVSSVCRENVDDFEMSKLLDSKAESAGEKSDDSYECLERFSKEKNLCESELDKKTSDEVSSSLDKFLNAGKPEEEDEPLSATVLEQLRAQSNVIKTDHTIAYIQPDEHAARLQQLADFNTSRNINEVTTFTEEQLYLPCQDSAEKSNQAQQVAGKDDSYDDKNDGDDDDLKDYDKDDEVNTIPKNASLHPLDYITHEITITDLGEHSICGKAIEGDVLTFLKNNTTNKIVTKIETPEHIPEDFTMYKLTPEHLVSENIPAEKETELQKNAEASPQEDVAKADKPEKQITEVTEIAGAAEIVATAATAVAATTATAVTATKAKATSSTTAKRPATKSTTRATPVTKTATKPSTLTSPSKAISTTLRATSTQSAAAKKPPAARPKQLDGTTKVLSTSKTTAARAMTTSTAPPTTITLKATTSSTMPKVSPRRITSTTKPKATTAAVSTSLKSSAGATAERKPTNGDAKLAGKTTVTAKPPVSAASRTSSGAIAKTTLVKTSSTTTKTTLLSAAAPKPRSASVKTSTSPLKHLSTGTSTMTTGATRPKTAPPSTGTPKSRDSTGKTLPAKSPSIDKQSKETVNKQISRSSASPSPRTTVSRVSGSPSVPKTRTPTGKSPGNASAISPMKRSAVTSKAASKPAAAEAKNVPTSETKVLQNGIFSSMSKTVVIMNNVMGNKLEDDVPRKDPSPVNVPTDNQLIDN